MPRIDPRIMRRSDEPTLRTPRFRPPVFATPRSCGAGSADMAPLAGALPRTHDLQHLAGRPVAGGQPRDGSPYSYNEPYGLRPTQATYQAASRMFSPPGYRRGRTRGGPEPAGRSGGARPAGHLAAIDVCPPLRADREVRINLLGPPPGVAPGAPTWTSLPQDGRRRAIAGHCRSYNPQNRGFIEGLLGGLVVCSGRRAHRSGLHRLLVRHPAGGGRQPRRAAASLATATGRASGP